MTEYSNNFQTVISNLVTIVTTTYHEAAVRDDVVGCLRDVRGVGQVVVRVRVLAVTLLYPQQEALQSCHVDLRLKV